MKKSLSLILIIYFVTTNSYAQINLVPNAGFETIDSCNLQFAAIFYGQVPFWNAPTSGSPDAYNICTPSSTLMSVPLNYFGYQYPHSGNGYAGVGLYGNDIDKEYIQVELDSTLVSQKTYCASFYVSLCNKARIANNNIGMCFSNTIINVPNYLNLNFTPQINDTNIVSDTLNWTLISGQFIAQGGERYLIIGSFIADSLADTTHLNSGVFTNISYYYIDDVNVHCCSCDSTSHVGVGEMNKKENVELYPNPATNELTIEIKNIKAKSIKLINVLGEVVTNKEKVGVGKMEVDVGNLAKGIYFVEVESEVGIMRRKFVKE